MDRPHIALGMASSVDGKLVTREKVKLRYGSDEDRLRLEARRVDADAVLIGKGELLADDPPLLLRLPETIERRLRSRPPEEKHPWNVVAATRLDFDPAQLEFFRHPETRRLVFTTDLADSHRIEETRRVARVEIVPAGHDGRVDLVAMVRRMAELGICSLMLEGGGTLNAAMLALELVDEVHLTLCPFIFGGAATPTTVGGPGFVKETIKCLELLSSETSPSGEIFLHYRVDPRGARVEPSPVFKNAYRISRHEGE